MAKAAKFPLHEAAGDGDIDTLNRLLSEGADVDCRDDVGGTALMLAAEAGRVDTVAMLLEHGANPNATDNFQSTALMLGVYKGHVDVVGQLIASDANIHAINKWGRTALDCVKFGNADGVRKRLVDAGALVGLVESALLEDKEKVAKILAGNVSVDHTNEGGMTALMAAASKGNIELASTLLNHGAGLSLRDTHGESAFTFAVANACLQGSNALLSLLLECGVDLKASSQDSYVAAQTAIRWGSESILQFLLNHGVDPNAASENMAEPLLNHAVRTSHRSTSMVEMLINNGADIEGTNWRGHTPLIIAVMRRFDTKEDAGYTKAKARIRRASGMADEKPEWQSARDVVNLLVARGANVNACAGEATVLAYAACRGDAQIVKWLLDAGAEANPSHGIAPIDCAHRFGNQEVVALLRKYGATETATIVDEDSMSGKIAVAIQRALGMGKADG